MISCSALMESFFFIFLLSISHAAAHVVLAPNTSTCSLPSLLPEGESPFNCCAPSADYAPRLFTPDFSSSSLRVRPSAHGVDEAYAEKLARAYSLMRALPADDPRSFMQQANIHCAYCNEVYNQMNFPDLPFQIHGSWLFFSFHRWYLYFHERILAKLLGDDDFAIPFWNYDHPDRAAVPWLYSNYNLTLIDDMRDLLHGAPAPAAVDYTWDTDSRSREKQLRENANSMYRGLIRDATSKVKFFGVPYRAGETYPVKGFGTVESRPHNSMHLWMGQKSQIGWKDMGSLYAAARDPIFYAHHAMIDRLWEVWKAMPNNYDFDDKDYLEAEFAFYNEDAELVRVKVRDSLNTTELGYVYEDVENLWKEAVPVRRSEGEAKLTANDSICEEGKPVTAPCSIVIERDAEAAKGSSWGEIVVVAMEYAVNEANYMDVYINLPGANVETDTGCEEYYDFMMIIPLYHGLGSIRSRGSGGNATALFKFREVKERLEALELREAGSLILTLVPRPLNASTAYLAFLNASILLQPQPQYYSSYI